MGIGEGGKGGGRRRGETKEINKRAWESGACFALQYCAMISVSCSVCIAFSILPCTQDICSSRTNERTTYLALPLLCGTSSGGNQT